VTTNYLKQPDISTTIGYADLPVGVVITKYVPAIAGSRTGHPDTWDEGQPAEIEFRLLDAENVERISLYETLTDADVERIEQLIIDKMERGGFGSTGK